MLHSSLDSKSQGSDLEIYQNCKTNVSIGLRKLSTRPITITVSDFGKNTLDVLLTFTRQSTNGISVSTKFVQNLNEPRAKLETK